MKLKDLPAAIMDGIKEVEFQPACGDANIKMLLLQQGLQLHPVGMLVSCPHVHHSDTSVKGKERLPSLLITGDDSDVKPLAQRIRFRRDHTLHACGVVHTIYDISNLLHPML